MSTKNCAVWIAVALLVTGVASASEFGLTATLFPDGKSIDVPISGTQRAPAAEVTAKVKHAAGQSTVEMSYKKLAPAILFGGDMVAYVVWVVSPDGSVENVGGVANDGIDKGALKFSTAKREFAMMITAEPIRSVRSPGNMVVFFSGTPAVKDLKITAFTFGGLSDREGLVSVERDSIAGMTYKVDKKHPLALIQAEKAGELLKRFDASTYDSTGYDTAMSALNEAHELKGSAQLEAAERSLVASGQALRKTGDMLKMEAQAAMEAEAAAERQALSIAALSSMDRLAATEARLKKSETNLASTRSQVKTLQASQARSVRREEAIEQQLSGAIGQMATGAKTDRGYVVSLSGTAFPSGKSTLTTDGKYVLAKLSGMLLVMPDAKLSVEGHTDSTGGEELNQKLSQSRAEAVQYFLKEMGVPDARMKSRGFGPDRPIAPNDTAEGRAKNRRVEIVVVDAY